VKWFRSLAAAASLAVGVCLLPLSGSPAYAGGKVTPITPEVTVSSGSILTVGQLFRFTPSALVGLANVDVIAVLGVRFAPGFRSTEKPGSQIARFPSYSVALGVPVVAIEEGGVLLLENDQLVASVVIKVTPTVTIQPTTTTAPPTTVAPAPPIVPPQPAPAPVPPVTPPAPAPTPPPVASTPLDENRPPVALGRSVVARKNSSTAMTLKGTDPEGSPLVYDLVEVPDNGLLTGSAPNLTYTPSRGFTGTDAFTFTVSDGVSTSETAAVSITVKSSAPVARTAVKKGKKK
jgi:hypothetical protein